MRYILLCLALTGCNGIQPVSDHLDQAESIVYQTRVNYQDRLDRVSIEWICTGMSWKSLLELTNQDMQLVNLIIKGCGQRSFPTLHLTPETIQ